MTSMVQIEDQAFKWFGEAAVMLDLVPFPTFKDTKNNFGHGEEGELVGKLALMWVGQGTEAHPPNVFI